MQHPTKGEILSCSTSNIEREFQIYQIYLISRDALQVHYEVGETMDNGVRSNYNVNLITYASLFIVELIKERVFSLCPPLLFARIYGSAVEKKHPTFIFPSKTRRKSTRTKSFRLPHFGRRFLPQPINTRLDGCDQQLGR